MVAAERRFGKLLQVHRNARACFTKMLTKNQILMRNFVENVKKMFVGTKKYVDKKIKIKQHTVDEKIKMYVLSV